MVNPNKHKDNLNEEDLEEIYNRLNKKYEHSRDYNTKKQLNQQILILILLCRKFPAKYLVEIKYDFFELESNDILTKHLKEHLSNNFCEVDGLLLTNRNKQALKNEDIPKILSNIDHGLKKEVTIEALTITKSKLNDNGKKNFNKKNIKNYITSNKKLEELKKQLEKIEEKEEKTTGNINEEDLNQKLNKVKRELEEHITNTLTNKNDSLSRELKNIQEKQDKLEKIIKIKEDKNNKSINKINENIKQSNIKNKKLTESINNINKQQAHNITNLDEENMENFNQNMNKILDRINDLTDKQEKINEKLNKIEYGRKYNEVEKSSQKVKKSLQESPEEKNNIIKSDNMSNKVNMVEEKDFKMFCYHWFNRNLKITDSEDDVIGLAALEKKLTQYITGHNMQIRTDILFNKLESYLKYWFNQTRKNMNFTYITNKSINGNKIYSNLKFMNLKEDRENRIKNTIIEWIRENTREKRGSKTYTQDIFNNLKPLFEDNGWIITKSEEWKTLHDMGLTKICESRSFSQIIGKSMKEVYKHTNYEIQRDTPNNTGKVTWYSNIEIINNKISSRLEETIKYELSDEINETDELIYTWLNDNITYTENHEVYIDLKELLTRIDEHLEKHDIKLEENTLEIIVKNYFKNRNATIEDNIIKSVQLKCEDNNNQSADIINTWINNHIIITDDDEDKAFLDEIYEKVLSHLHEANINIVNNDVYQELPESIKKKFITETKYKEILNNRLKEHITSTKIIDDPINGKYIKNTKIIRYNILKPEITTQWVEDNIESILKNSIVYKKDVNNRFTQFMTKNNIKNTLNKSVEEQIDEKIHEYYNKKKNIILKDLQDDYDTFYAIIQN